MNYTEAVRFLYFLGNELKVGAKWGLERIQALLAELAHPEQAQHFIHVAGTNGKGSTCAMIASVLRDAGIRTGLYTSPHLIEPTERIQIDGDPISPAMFARTFETVHAAAEKLVNQERIDAHPSYFETLTAMAFVLFRERCDVSVIEVGLGGRLDATNIITPELCVITPIAYDHESFLGNTLELIAVEKAGILKPGVPVVLARQNTVAEAVIQDRANQLNCEIIRTADAQLSEIEVSARQSTFCLNAIPYECRLPGRHQIENATAAILACKRLNVPAPAIQAGIKSAQWPGRLEFISHHPDFVLDGAHNPAGAAALAAYIREFRGSHPVWLVYGAMRDKAIDEVTAQLFPVADHLILTAPKYPRSLRPEAILDVTSHPNAVITATVSEAIDFARTAPRDAIVFFTGSLFLVGEARSLLS